MRLVIDSNVYISAMTVEGLSHEVLALSLDERAFRKKFKEPAELVEAKLSFLRDKTTSIKITGKLKTAGRDPDDDHVLEAVTVAKAEVLITGDKDLLVLKGHGSAQILSPREFIETFG